MKVEFEHIINSNELHTERKRIILIRKEKAKTKQMEISFKKVGFFINYYF